MSNWTGNQRADGVAIRQMLNDAFEIIRPGSPAVDRCPCCGAILLTQRAARLVADRIYPLTEEEAQRGTREEEGEKRNPGT